MPFSSRRLGRILSRLTCAGADATQAKKDDQSSQRELLDHEETQADGKSCAAEDGERSRSHAIAQQSGERADDGCGYRDSEEDKTALSLGEAIPLVEA